MFETSIGPVKDAGSTVYLRPETAQGIFLDFKTTLQYARKKPPFGIAQIGKSFRNEITPGNFIFRTSNSSRWRSSIRAPCRGGEVHDYWMEADSGTCRSGSIASGFSLREHDTDELSHYSSPTSDIEYLYPIGWKELEGIANRGDFDLTTAAEHSGQKLDFKDRDVAIRPARDRARRRRRPHLPGAALRRLRRGRHRRRAAHGAAARARGSRRSRRRCCRS